jgi:holo-[acyl-carrier protein] synthase
VTAFSVGTDIVAVDRVRSLVERSGAGFVGRWFTADEAAYCSTKARPEQHLAARLAAKEAVVKALSLPWDGPIPYNCVEISTDANGAPAVRLSGRVLHAAEASGIRHVSVSLAHCDAYATAVAVASAGGSGRDLP